MIIPIALVAIFVFIMLHYSAQKRMNKRDDRRERIKEYMEEIVASVKNKEEKNKQNN